MNPSSLLRRGSNSSRDLARTYSDSFDDDENSFIRGGRGGDSFSLSQESASQSFYEFPFSSQESSSFWPPNSSDSQDNLPPKKLKKVRNGKLVEKRPSPSTTLMEAQECGEMMEHADEVNFALDGLRKGQPVRTRRANLLSLL